MVKVLGDGDGESNVDAFIMRLEVLDMYLATDYVQ